MECRFTSRTRSWLACFWCSSAGFIVASFDKVAGHDKLLRNHGVLFCGYAAKR